MNEILADFNTADNKANFVAECSHESVANMLVMLQGRVKVLELELEDLRQFRQNYRNYSKKHRLKQKALADLAKQYLDKGELDELDKQIEDQVYE